MEGMGYQACKEKKFAKMLCNSKCFLLTLYFKVLSLNFVFQSAFKIINRGFLIFHFLKSNNGFSNKKAFCHHAYRRADFKHSLFCNTVYQ